jgi:EAL domain-containing protein (putative c-di-GMP-specific phosphodiesterase class I)
MSIINKVWGNENGDYLLNEFEKHIDRLHGMESDNSVFIKTHNAEFLVANFTNEKGGSAEYDETLKKLKSINYKRGEFQPEVRIASSSISFSPDNPLQSEFVKLVVNRSIKESKENNNESLRCDTADMERLVENVKKDEKTRYFIKQAFTQNNFFPFFHTIQSAKTEKPHHVEVLARVCDDNTCMPAGVFIDYLVHTDRVIELDKVILRKLRSNLDQLKNIVEKVFINISPKSLRSTEYILILEDFIKTTKKMNMETVFEITEQSLFDNIEIVKALHKKYDAIFAIDDFGAGYSNFSIVSDLAQEGLIKYIKIDGSLIRNICDNVIKEHIVKGITQVSHLDIVR